MVFNSEANSTTASSRFKSTGSLSVIVPVFNEERWLDRLMERVLKRKEVAQVIAVDDGSTDGSRGILETWQIMDSRVNVLTQPENRGKGAAIRTAIKHASAPIVLIQDADLEYDPADYPRLVAPILDGWAEVVYGSRFSEPNNGALGLHVIGNRLLTFISNRLTGLRLTDEATCYKAFLREVLQDLELNETGFGFCPEVTAKIALLVRRNGLRLVEVPVSYHARNRAEGKKIRLRDGLRAVYCLMKYSKC